jgi:cytoskeleton protein RodZ
LTNIPVYSSMNWRGSEVAACGGMGPTERMERFCDELRWERERRQISIEKICEETKVAPRHLLALEAGEYGDLPGGVFRKGIVRSYLAALGLDEVPWIERFEASLRESGTLKIEGNDWTEFAENVRRNRVGAESPTGMRWMGVAMMVGSLVALGLGVWKFALHGRLIP